MPENTCGSTHCWGGEILQLLGLPHRAEHTVPCINFESIIHCSPREWDLPCILLNTYDTLEGLHKNQEGKAGSRMLWTRSWWPYVKVALAKHS
jgi:hypothetical protein